MKQLNDWSKIVSSSNLEENLCVHFSYLADSPGYEKLLAAIMKLVDAARIEEENLVISFVKGIELSVQNPESEIAAYYPESFKKLLRHHQFLCANGDQLVLGDQALFCESDGWFEEMDEWREICDLNKVVSPLTEGPDLWLYHPTEKNASGEPKLFFKAHDGGDVGDPREINIGALFLEKLAGLLEIDVYEVLHPIDEAVLSTWWESLDVHWQKFFKKDIVEKPDKSFLKNLWKETSICLAKDSAITTLEPLKVFYQLERLLIEDLDFKDFSPLESLNSLKSLSIVNMPFKDFEGFNHLKNLGSLRLENTGFSNLNSLKPLKKLYSLALNHNPIQSLKGIEQCKELVRLEIDHTQITSISPIKSLPQLNYLHIRHLQLIDHDQLPSIKPLLQIVVQDSRVGDFKAVKQGLGLKKYFEFLTKIKGTNDQGIYFPTGTDTICSMEDFVTYIKTIDFPAKKYAEIIHLYANRLLLNALKSKQLDHCTSLIIEIQKLNLKPSPAIFQLYMGNVVVALCMMEPNIELENPIFEKLNASKITDQRLAFNIACYHAIRKDKAAMLNAIKIAVKLGKPKEQFMNDTDFSIYHNDPDFMKALTEKKENTSNTIKKPWKKN